MSESIQKAPSRPLGAINRGTQPLQAGDLAAGSATSPEATPSAGPSQVGDRSALAFGASRLGAFAQAFSEPSLEEAIDRLRDQAKDLLDTLPPYERQQAEFLLGPLLKGGGETLSAFRDRLKQMLNKLAQFIQEKKDAQRHIEFQQSFEWRMFFESLERYIENLQTLAKVEQTIQTQRLLEDQSVARKVDRDMAAQAALPPEQRMSLLSARLSQQS